MNIKVLDTTLRDGEQTPGVSLTSLEKLRIATKLDEIGVEYIEAGSAITSEGERESIKDITSQGFGAEILSFSRPLTVDIDYCLDCDVDGVNLVVPTSELHIHDKLNISCDELIDLSNDAVDYCKDHGLVVELSAEDASRSNVDFLRKVYSNAIDHGADRICVCDTVGILTPDSSLDLFSKLNDFSVPIACHCHNDFGLAVANTLAALKGGASEIHTTINGIGERAGNTSFEECVVSINRLLPQFSTNVKIDQIYDISKLVARSTGVYIQPNKAIVGENAFAHESGIHSDGVIKNSATYEAITPELVGRKRKFIIGKHMGTHGLDNRLKELGLNVDDIQLKQICDDIKELADKGKTVTDVDLQVIADNVLEINHEDRIKLDELTIVSGNKVMPTASVKITVDDVEILNAGVGLGPVDAAINALKSVDAFKDIDLIEYHVDSITGGTDAFIDVIIKLQKEDKVVSARGTEADIINASVKAYIAGVNRLLRD
ncbi:2-isopropylmalate synthase [Methanobrevibacter sp.]|uniref:(R)-citramalate synthase n=1 Tax=Methanobrevibacter sp. TaxID=66852 RepID=UPI00257FDF06|nr:2-isopropylmalate synthase [Methanobrevibacter sp.]MBR2665890.1 2-isopropylmalate synthase [Methanobrevibacter sp.]MBR3197420.1 2-isopropylmalate synthase [Methanobrevibacter sp.]